APKSTDPNWIIRIALFELDPNPSANLRNHVSSHLLSGNRNAWHAPTGRHDPKDIGDAGQNPSNLQRVNVVDHRTAIFAEKLFSSPVAHLSFLRVLLSDRNRRCSRNQRIARQREIL